MTSNTYVYREKKGWTIIHVRDTAAAAESCRSSNNNNNRKKTKLEKEKQ
jgi:hypothetical protein